MGCSIMKCILTPNLNPPHNLIQIFPAYDQPQFVAMTEDDVIQAVIARHKETGTIGPEAPVYIVEEHDTPKDSFDSWFWDDGIKVRG